MICDPKYVPICASGVTCHVAGCAKPATRKVGEEIFDDDPMPERHNFTAYVCLDHFNWIMGLETSRES